MTTIKLDGAEVEFEPGETLYDVSRRHRKDVPTLCYDERLEAFGACRLCVVEVDGIRNPVASCTTAAEGGMVVRTETDGLERHRRTLMELVVSENPAGSHEGAAVGWAGRGTRGGEPTRGAPRRPGA